ncbi:MAG TPA: erythromycin esterase family protein [Bryobacteraceae bacterium]|nr:erythromycin esterase family protein [Bryobacteraceae bacterium]
MRYFILTAAALALPAMAQEASPVTQWISSHAIRLATPVAGHGFDDMQPLRKVIGDARIVELGEATHGTREFFQLKHRMLEFLATQMGFSIFSIEANMPEAYKLNDYVLRGEGDPAKLLKGMYFWTWDTEEVLDMIKWMRAFNESGKGKVEFTGFDMQTPNVAWQTASDFGAKYDPEYHLESAIAQAKKAGPRSTFGVATGTFPVSEAAGKKIRFSGYIKTSNVMEGYAGLWWRVDGPNRTVLAFDNMQNRGVIRSTDWKEYSIELPVAANATNINFGALFPGTGTAWFDDFKVEIDGQPYDASSLFDFSFESPTPKGFYTGGQGYSVMLDNEVFHSGKHSLMMRSTERGGDAKAASAVWRDVIAHLESSRAAYRTKGATDRDIDWAVQNARVVLQSLEMKSDEVSRDRSMADNIQWIADHSPNAKIVVWAHNGHVRQDSAFGYEPMGAALRKMFGKQMVIFGFAFNEGSFQAVSQQKHMLHDFTVPPAPPGSLDAMLASAGLPLFALDLRQLPASGPVADWFHEAHDSRGIGAIYPEDSPFALLNKSKSPEAFDALLFVANATAARKNPPAGN